jgi:RNA polymerase sigma-70 factor (sigma-E family)
MGLMAQATAADKTQLGTHSERTHELSTLFFAEYPGLWSVAFAMVGDAHLAEEIVMESFVRVSASWRRVRRLDYPPGYLKKIVINLCRSKLRRRAIELRVNALTQRRNERELHGWESTGSDTRLDLMKAIGQLPPRQRACVVLRYFDDMTDHQIAETLDCSVGTVKSHLFRARRTLEQTLDRSTEVDE